MDSVGYCVNVFSNLLNRYLHCSFTKKDSSQVKVLDVAKFGSWKYGKESLNQRMPWLSSGGSSLLTTSDGKTEFGSIISKNTNAPSWIKETDPSPTVVWYWMREAPGMD